MPGSSKKFSLNGRTFAIPRDTEPEITLGGLVNTEPLINGDGTSSPKKSRVPGAIRGLVARVVEENGDEDALQILSGLDGVTIRYDGPEGTYTGTGAIYFSEDGMKVNKGMGTTDAFNFICSNGRPLFRLA